MEKSFVDGDEQIDYIKSKSEIYVKDVKQFTKKIQNEKQKLLDDSFTHVKSLTRDLENLKLQNEELEVIIQGLSKEKDNLENSYDLLNKSFNTLSDKYKETRDLLETSHQQNINLSEAIERIRQNEKSLIEESQKLRRVGSTGSFGDLQNNLNISTIENLKKQLKFWQEKASKLNEIINLQDQTSEKVNVVQNSKQKNSKKKSSNSMKRYNKVIVRSHSLENSQRASKENEYSKLKMEKEQMKNLLNNLEHQIFEIQNNIVKISNEKQKFKQLYLEKKEKLDKSESMVSILETQMDEKLKEITKITSENEKYSQNINILIQDNKRYQILNQNLSKEINDNKSEHLNEINNINIKMNNVIEENRQLGTRSNNLKDKIQTLETEFSSIEQDLKNKNQQIKDQSDFIETLNNQIKNSQLQLKDKCEQINNISKELTESQQENKNLRKTAELLEDRLDSKTKECNATKMKVRDKGDEINQIKTSFSAQVIKFENHLQNAEQIISSKIKLINNLELKLVNNEKELKLKDEELLQLKKMLNSKSHEHEILIHKYEESQDSKQYLQQHLDTITVNNNNSIHEVIALNQTISDLNAKLEKLENEFALQKELLIQKDEKLLLSASVKRELEREISLKDDEINKHKKCIAQARSEIDGREAQIGSLLDIVDEKELKISKMNITINEKENMIKEYGTQLNHYDNSMVQSTARGTALEKEIENLRNANIRLSRQKEQISLSLSERNKELGHMKAKLESLECNETRCRHSICNEPITNTNNKRENGFNETDFKIKTPVLNGRYEGLDKEHQQLQSSGTLLPAQMKTSLADNYDPIALRSRAHSYDGRELRCVDCI